MKKRIVAMMVSAMMVISLAGCGSKLSNDYITINQYKGLEVAQVEDTEVTDDDVNTQIDSNLESTATTEEITDRAVEDGDTINMTYTSDFDEKENTYDLIVGSNSLVGENGDYKGFEEQLIGHKIGKKFKVKVKFPADYQEESLQNKVSTFKVTINSISKTTTPELTDEWVAANSETSKTVEEYKAEVKKSLETDNQNTATTTIRNEVITALLEQVEVAKYPEDQVEEQVTQMTDYYKSYAEQSSLEFADFLEQQLNMTEDDFNTEVKKAAQETIKKNLAVQLIVDKKKLEPSDKEYKEEYEALATEYGAESGDALIEQAGEDAVKNVVLQRKVADYLIKSCVQVENTDTSTSDTTSTDTTSTEE